MPNGSVAAAERAERQPGALRRPAPPPLGVGRADAVLGAEAAAEAVHDEPQHQVTGQRLLPLVRWRRRAPEVGEHEVAVHPAVPPVPEVGHERPGQRRPGGLADLGHQTGQHRTWDRHVEAHHAAQVRQAVGDPVPHGPGCPRGHHHGVADRPGVGQRLRAHRRGGSPRRRPPRARPARCAVAWGRRRTVGPAPRPGSRRRPARCPTRPRTHSARRRNVIPAPPARSGSRRRTTARSRRRPARRRPGAARPPPR